MKVPEEIRNVPRPVNTVVYENKSNGIRKYIVRERSGEKYVQGGNPQPSNGSIVGYIYNGEFIPKDVHVKTNPTVETTANEETKENNETIQRKELLGKELLGAELQYGAPAFANSVVKDLFDDLKKIFDLPTAVNTLVIAMLRVVNPGIKNCRLAKAYDKSYLKIYYPGATLSAGYVGNLLDTLGKDVLERNSFYWLRTSRITKDTRIAVDGTLKQDNSSVNDLSAYTARTRTKGRKNLSIIYAYNIDNGEPICAEVFPGNYVDSNAYAPFIKDNKITKGLIVTDKGFPPSKIASLLSENKDLHFLTPLKRTDKRIANNNMLDYDGILIEGRPILYKKAKIKGGNYLYSFFDQEKAAIEEKVYLTNAALNKSFNLKQYKQKRELFGTIVFESDCDTSPLVIYRSYDDRWILEVMFDLYKNDEHLDETRVQSDYSVIGSEFINFIATVINCRLEGIIKKSGLADKDTFKGIMEDLRQSWRRECAPTPPVTQDKYWVHTNLHQFEILEALGLSTPQTLTPTNETNQPSGAEQTKVEKRKEKPIANNSSRRSSTQHKSKSPSSKNKILKRNTSQEEGLSEKITNSESALIQEISSSTTPTCQCTSSTDPSSSTSSPDVNSTHPLTSDRKRKRGRPRKYPPPDPNAPKRPRGRPRKSPTSSSEQSLEGDPTVGTEGAS